MRPLKQEALDREVEVEGTKIPFVPLGGWKGFRVAMRENREEEAGDARTSGREAGLGKFRCDIFMH